MMQQLIVDVSITERWGVSPPVSPHQHANRGAYAPRSCVCVCKKGETTRVISPPQLTKSQSSTEIR